MQPIWNGFDLEMEQIFTCFPIHNMENSSWEIQLFLGKAGKIPEYLINDS